MGEPIHKIVNKDTRNKEIDYTSATIYLQYTVIWCEKLQKGFGVCTSITWWSVAHDGVCFKIRNTAGQLNWKHGCAHLTVCMVNFMMKLLLKIPTKIDINYYGKMVPWLSLKLSQSRSGAEFSIGQKPTQLAENIFFWAGTIFPPCGPVAPKQWCAVVAVISLDARERLSAESLSLNLKFLLVHMGFARAQIANSCNILNLYQIRNLKSYCRSVLVF